MMNSIAFVCGESNEIVTRVNAVLEEHPHVSITQLILDSNRYGLWIVFKPRRWWEFWR